MKILNKDINIAEAVGLIFCSVFVGILAFAFAFAPDMSLQHQNVGGGKQILLGLVGKIIFTAAIPTGFVSLFFPKKGVLVGIALFIIAFLIGGFGGAFANSWSLFTDWGNR